MANKLFNSKKKKKKKAEVTILTLDNSLYNKENYQG